jgi:hypothetical protein
MTKSIVLDEDGVAALEALVNYNWQDELIDFMSHEGKRDCHIFASLNFLSNLLYGTNYEPEYWAERSQS